ncbi:MAG: PQQ-dependent sugar dehydrogenase, partial [Patescibacteria group bacterium]
MNWKKILRSLALFAVGMAVFAAVVFYAIDALRIARGLKPVVLKPSQDITEIIPRAGEVVTENEEAAKNETDMPLALPEGFSVSIFAKDLKAPRVMMWGPDGNLWTSIPSQGKIVALRDANGDGFAEEIMTILDGLNRPHGMASRCDGARCTIYIAESHQVAAYEYERGVLLKSKKKVADLPDGGRHFTRTLMFMPYPNENILLISVGSSCDVCHEEDARRAKILALDVVSGEVKEFAKGLRNSVFMAIHPVTGKIWATEMGRDMLGDDLPPDEINIIEEGEWYGWPWFYGKNIEDYNFSPYSRPSFAVEPKPSFIDIPAHSAPLGLAFFPEEGWPQEYWYNLLVAYHGSWNKREPTGYK